jgi:hypothetical protein
MSFFSTNTLVPCHKCDGGNPKCDPSKPFVYIGLTPLPVNRRFDFRRATPEHEWRLHKFGIRLMPELYDSLRPMTYKRALQTAKKTG